MPLTATERAQIAAEQREANARAIRQCAIENPNRVVVPGALAASIKYAEQNDGASVQRALTAVGTARLIVTALADAGAVNPIAAGIALDALAKVRDILAGFAPVPKQASRSTVQTKREELAA
jgi:hypothetical protein